MKAIQVQPGLTEQVYQSLLSEICEGTLVPGTHLIQEKLAAALGVSRHPVQQALAILKSEGLIRELGGRGLFVAPLDVDVMRHHYDIRAVLDGLAARRAAEAVRSSSGLADEIRREGELRVQAGEQAIRSGAVGDIVQRDVEFHAFIYAASANPLLIGTAAPHWRYLRRVMSDVIRRTTPAADIWRQHADILAAVVAGDPEAAERLATAHVDAASRKLAAALASDHVASTAGGDKLKKVAV